MLKNIEDTKKNIDAQMLIEGLIRDNRSYHSQGRVATYIPLLASANSEDVGITICDINGNCKCSGEYSKKFTIQSISKVISLMLTLMDHGEEYVFDIVSSESPNGTFDYIETSPLKKDNPMTNAGAITICSMIKGRDNQEKLDRILLLTKKLSNNDDICVNNDVYISEKETGNKNKAIAYLLKDRGKVNGNVMEVLDLYFKQCSIEINTLDLAHIAAVIANNGVSLTTGVQLVPSRIIQLIKANMIIFGMYNESGNVLMKTGIPSKSGVSGGIMSVIPGKMGIGIYNPSLNENGNSIVGIKILEDLVSKLDINIF